jgi:ankyrin repeat protein
MTPLALAARAKNDPITKFLIEHGAEVSEAAAGTVMNSPLQVAVWTNTETSIRTLLEAGADVNLKDERGKTLLHYAAEARNRGAIARLLELGADVNAQDADGATALHLVVRAGDSQRLGQMLTSLLDAGADVNLVDAQGRVALHYAVEANAPNAVAAILGKNAEVNVKDKAGLTPFGIAMQGNNMQLKRTLREHGAY